MVRKPELKIARGHLLFQIVSTLENAYEQDISFPIRLKKVGALVDQLSQIRNIDKELLSWVAIGRWLSRHNNFQLAIMCLHEYQGLSLKLSSGRCQDVLGLCNDLHSKQWFRFTS